jgi:hypothetical protein
MISAFKSKVIKELEDKYARIDALTLEELQSGIIDEATHELKNTRCMTNRRKENLNKCIKALKNKMDTFYEPFDYDAHELEVGKEYFENLYSPYMYKTLGQYIETKCVVKEEAGGHGFVTRATHLGAVFSADQGIWIEPTMGNARLKIFSKKPVVVV